MLEPSEAVKGRAKSEAPTGYTFFDFESVRPRPELTGGIAWSIGFAHYRYVSGKRTVKQFMCMPSGQTDRGAERWTYQAAGPLTGATDPAKAPLGGATGKPALKLETRPDRVRHLARLAGAATSPSPARVSYTQCKSARACPAEAQSSR